ncbi:MAG: cysteate synthase [Nitrospirae bacterium]|nr:MAG: cysteate synthase [Nitrospirota bacterium]
MPHYKIRCKHCGSLLKDTYCAFCEHCQNALLVTEYNDTSFRYDCGEGIWRYNWLPVHRPEFIQPGPVVYHSEALGRRLGLKRLYIAFNGYWPDRGAEVKTCTFKEYEAAVALENARENGVKGLVVASAGNTARAFAHLSTRTNFPVIIVVPKMCLLEMWYLVESVRVPTVAVSDGDYADSIDVARRISSIMEMPFEGGVKNIAKRDGLGVVLMEAVRVMGRLPEHYFQAVGSGTGAIGVWEMAERFLRDGRWGDRLPRLHLAQNLPFAPMVKAWSQRSRELDPSDLNPSLINLITTRVLSNRYPAYGVVGGVYDALSSSGGEMYGVENEEVFYAMRLFEETEGIDIVPASAVAVGALIQALKAGSIGKDDTVLLNITGGGERIVEKHCGTFIVEPLFVSKNTSDKQLEELLCRQLKID